MSNEAVAQQPAGGGNSAAANDDVDVIDPAKYRKIDAIIERYRDKPGSLIPVLQQAQEVCGYLPHAVQRYIAKGMRMSPSVVFGVATFYSFFTLVPRGKYVIRVCLGTACYVKRSEEILEKLKEELDIEVGEITRDKKYSIEAVRCLGACGLAPVVVIGQDTYGDVAATKVMEIVKKYD
ncbi:MAG TPA: NAD(P)H-dependent oxidoreductase subunit E [Nitrospirota bacterium]|nr:NAD(P)H-dependent oxidoreductase subunit E [Nitrospirota bacterium]